MCRVVCLHVDIQLNQADKLSLAQRAEERITKWITVDFQMIFQFFLIGALFIANATPAGIVREHVILQSVHEREARATFAAHVRFLAGMRCHVELEMRATCKRLVTLAARVRFFTGVNPHVISDGQDTILKIVFLF